jgi:osmoprotectant transport system substrate-binding protein
MTINHRLRVSFVMLAVAALAIGISACGGGDDNETSTTTAAQAIQSNPANGNVTLTVGSKNFTEEYILGELYARALRAAGYTVNLKRSIGPTEVVDKRSPPARSMPIPSTPARPSPPSPARTS